MNKVNWWWLVNGHDSYAPWKFRERFARIFRQEMPQISRNQGRILMRRLVINEFQLQIGSTCLSDEEKRSTNMDELNASVWYRGRGGVVVLVHAVQSEIRKQTRHIEIILRTAGQENARKSGK